MQPKLTTCLLTAVILVPCGCSTAATYKYTVVPRATCSADTSKPAASIILDTKANASYEKDVLVNPPRCKAMEDSYLRFYSTSKVEKAAIVFVKNGTTGGCENPELGASPVEGGDAVFEAKIANGFVQPIEIKIGNVAAGLYYYCADLGVQPMPNPAIIIKE